ncbi:MAG: lysine--tRNA ligase [Parvibaculum sp.]
MTSDTPAASAAASLEAFQRLGEEAKAWPFEEARKLVKRIEKHGLTNDEILFETGYGPSGLPHIGTFGEVARTTMVRHAFQTLMPDVKTRLLCVSDDMDGMRKIPDNVPNQDMLQEHLHKPLTRVPDPFGTHESFGHHNNARLRAFLDTYGFEYEFASATDYYRTGRFDHMLLRALDKFDDIMNVMLPTLGPERRATYSPFLPISPSTGRVLYVPMKKIDAKAGTVTFADEDGTEVTLPVTGGNVKLQWKPDFGMRWAALNVDFEMFGKDHQTNSVVYDRICKILGAEPPEHFVFELFLDDKGQKISKSKGNGLTIDEWLRYASPESLQLYMYQAPRKAKRLHFDVIPKHVDEYLSFMRAYPGQESKDQIGNPVWHIHVGEPPVGELPISFALLINLVSASHSDDPDVIWGFIRKYAPGATAEDHPRLNDLVGYAINYFNDFVKPNKSYRAANNAEQNALEDLAKRLEGLNGASSAEDLQTIVYEIGKTHGFENLRDWFKTLYEVLLGESQGPRFGSFIALYGVPETAALIRRALAGDDLSSGEGT